MARLSKIERIKRRLYVRRWQVLIDLICERVGCRAMLGAEIGVRAGGTSAALLHEFPGLSLYMVDPWACTPQYPQLSQETHDAHFRSAMERTFEWRRRRIVLHMASQDARKFVENESLDFLFIDGDHAEGQVYSDCAWWAFKLKRNGLFCGHDYYDADRKKPRGTQSVKAAVDRYAEVTGVEVVLHKSTIWEIR